VKLDQDSAAVFSDAKIGDALRQSRSGASIADIPARREDRRKKDSPNLWPRMHTNARK